MKECACSLSVNPLCLRQTWDVILSTFTPESRKRWFYKSLCSLPLTGSVSSECFSLPPHLLCSQTSALFYFVVWVVFNSCRRNMPFPDMAVSKERNFNTIIQALKCKTQGQTTKHNNRRTQQQTRKHDQHETVVVVFSFPAVAVISDFHCLFCTSESLLRKELCLSLTKMRDCQ